MIDPIIKKILGKRGIRTETEISDFFHTSWEKFSHDPSRLKHLDRAIDRLKEAVRKKQKIAICGDYDGDGIPGAAILYLTLKQMGARNLLARVGKGHEVGESLLRELAKKKYRVLVTVDLDLGFGRKAASIGKRGIDLIVLDHHLVQKRKPQSFAYINPKQSGDTYPWDGLSGAGLAFKLAQALSPEAFRRYKDYFTVLAAIAAIHDNMPLLNENRLLVSRGLELLPKLRGHDLSQAAKILKVKEGIKHIGHDSAFRVIEFLFNIFDSQHSLDLLIKKGHSRRFIKELTDSSGRFHRHLNDAMARVKRSPHFYKKNVLFEVFDDIPYVTTGAVASRAFKVFSMTTFIIRKGENGLSRGSARSSSALNLGELMAYCAPLLDGYGGHAQSAGFKIRNGKLEQFKQQVEKYLIAHFPGGKVPKDKTPSDATVRISDLNAELYEQIKRLAPFGLGNPVPFLTVKNAKLYCRGDDMIMKDATGMMPALPNGQCKELDPAQTWVLIGHLARKDDMLYFKIRDLKPHGRT